MRRAVQSERGTARGERTRRSILDAAYRVFERQGYVDTDVEDIVAEANVARGSFYTYFTSKLDVFKVVSDEVTDQVDVALHRTDEEKQLDPVEAVRRSNERYVSSYRRHARVYALFHQLAHIDHELEDRNVTRRDLHVDRIARSIRRWQSAGLADPAIAPRPTAAALQAMTSNVCYEMFVGQNGSYSEQQAADAINLMWQRTLDLRRRPSRRWLANGTD